MSGIASEEVTEWKRKAAASAKEAKEAKIKVEDLEFETKNLQRYVFKFPLQIAVQKHQLRY